MIKIGLDNGIILKTKSKILDDEIPDYIQIEKLSPEDEFDFGENEKVKENNFFSYDICYWRKCWGLRNKICNSIAFDERTNDFNRELTISNITDIIQILTDYLLYPNNWDEENNLWELVEYKGHIAQSIINLSWLRQYLRENSKAYCYFYDSY